MRAVKEFNLTLSRFDSEADNELGIWDGSQFVVTVRIILNPAHTYNADNVPRRRGASHFPRARLRAADGLPGSIALSFSGDTDTRLSGAHQNCTSSFQLVIPCILHDRFRTY
jgi:hypothetical protein